MSSTNQLALELMQDPRNHGGGRGSNRQRLLANAEVEIILKDPRRAREVAEDFGVSTSLIHSLKRGEGVYFEEPSKFDRYRKTVTDLAFIVPESFPVGRPTMFGAEQVEKIRSDARPLAEVAREYGTSTTTAWKIRTGRYRTGDTPVPDPRLLTPDIRAAVALDARPLELSARAFGLSVALVWKIRREAGRTRKASRLSVKDRAAAARDVRPLRQVAADLGVSAATVWRVRNGAGGSAKPDPAVRARDLAPEVLDRIALDPRPLRKVAEVFGMSASAIMRVKRGRRSPVPEDGP